MPEQVILAIIDRNYIMLNSIYYFAEYCIQIYEQQTFSVKPIDYILLANSKWKIKNMYVPGTGLKCYFMDSE